MKFCLLTLALALSTSALAQTAPAGTGTGAGMSSVPTTAQGTGGFTSVTPGTGQPANPAGYTQPTYPNGFRQPSDPLTNGAIQTPQTMQDSTNSSMSAPTRPRTTQEERALQNNQSVPAAPTQGIGIPDPQNPNPTQSVPGGVNPNTLPQR